ncbi:hypothetical protein ASPFODRAFT_573341 [Aspergillus luchuensis CBS 106.47]|uniref:Uncharacterized protein n=1 Tax=Aspergillus luchuensis (strain CBS 106.47) TaxID=1137211 RepID=A0A1M3TLD2_ASPLC|nr:hypothetical protein ASPFODRAFT_573341 [Aspergillus luchuensis CBS 106.47]
MNLSDALALASLILTAISTISIFTILLEICRTFKRLLFDREHAIKVQCGSWQSCIKNHRLPEHGLVEKAANPLKGWILKAYREGITLKMTTSDRKTQRTSCQRFCSFLMPTYDQTAQGTSSWSRLLARCGVESCKIPPSDRAEDRADILMENERILYGVSAEEFVVLLILGSWDITFALKRPGLSISHLGYMRICDDGPFRQIARYDDHGNAPISQSTAKRYEYSIPVKTAIDLAIGIFRIPSRGPHNIDMVILSDRRWLDRRWLNWCKNCKRKSRIGPLKRIGSVDQMSYWTSNPGTKQAEEIRFSLEKLVQEPSAKINNYETDKNSTDKMEMFWFFTRLLGQNNANSDVRKAATRVALVISSLEPWAILPAAPIHITHALCGVLKMQVRDDSGQAALITLLKGLRKMKKAKQYVPPGWTLVDLECALEDIPSIKDHFFSRSSDKCSIYHTAMKAVFRKANLSQHRTSYHLSCRGATIDNEKLIRFTLAAVLASKVLSKAINGDYVDEIFKKLCDIHELREAQPLRSDDDLVKIYATYLYGWFGNATKAGRKWRDAYRRRIFLE